MSKKVLTALPLTIVFVAAACGGAAGTTSPTPSTPTPTATGASPTPTSTPSAVPTATATRAAARTPTPVAAGNASSVVARLETFGELCCPVALTVITADGRVVTATDSGAYVERQITTAAVQRIRSELIASGLFAKDGGIAAEPNPGATPGPLPISGYNLRVWNGTALVRLQWLTIPADRVASYKKTSERTRADQLAAQLRAPEQWLAASDWTTATAKPYDATAYRFFLIDVPAGGTPPLLDATTWPFTKLPPAFGEPLAEAPLIPAGPGDARCVLLASSDLRAARDALGRAGATVLAGPRGFEFNTLVATGRSGIGTQIFAVPLLPDQPSCTAAY